MEKEMKEEIAPVIQRKWVEVVCDLATKKNKLPERNDMFAVGRLAYVFPLHKDGTYNDPFSIPTISIRSKADVASYQVDFFKYSLH
jgi:hypothetical protein